jgi:hypothetical protein
MADYRIFGRVLDATTSSAVSDVQLVLTWSRPLVSDGGSSMRDFIRPGRRIASSDFRGEYEFANLPSGEYKLIAGRSGYKTDSVGITIDGRPYQWSFSLERVPFGLVSVSVVDRPSSDKFHLPDSWLADSLHLRSLMYRALRGAYFMNDVRDITSRDISESITLAEPDLLRALQRTVGVGTRDDYTATIHTRGATWDRTRVFVDGQPVWNPTHAGWLLGSINPEGVGSALYFPGVRPAWLGEGAAGVLDIRSRRGGEAGRIRASADLSLVSARLSADGPLPGLSPGSSGGWMIAGRRTWVDWYTSAVQALGGNNARIPYDFSDVIARVDAPLPLGAHLEASGLYERDHLRGDFPGITKRNEGSWGNRVAQATLVLPVRGIMARLSHGATRFGTRLLELEDDGAAPGADDEATLPSLSNGLRNRSTTLEISSGSIYGIRAAWSTGAQFSRLEASYDGPFSLTAEGIPGVDPDRLIRIPFTYAANQSMTAGWLQMMLDVARMGRLDLGLRAETGGELANTGALRLSPRLAVNVTVDTATSVSAGWSRGYQYAQDVGAAAGPIGPQLHLTHIWQLASLGVPAVRSTITTVGIERRLSEDIIVGASGYLRGESGITIPDPVPGEIRSDRPLFKVAEGDASGIEIYMRRFSGRWTGSFGYSLARATLRSEGLSFPSPTDVTHTLDGTISVRVSDALRISSAFSYSSGVPYTRFVIGETALRLEDPYGRRAPAYAAADLSVDYNTRLGGHRVAAYIQLRNVFNRANRVTYSGSPEVCTGGMNETGVCAGSLHVTDRFDAGIPLLPLAGVRFVF